MPADKSDPARYLVLQFLAWLDESPRSYGDAMDAWRTSCPRLSIWEDALRDGLIERRIDNDSSGELRDIKVALTPRGRALLSADKKTRAVASAGLLAMDKAQFAAKQ